MDITAGTEQSPRKRRASGVAGRKMPKRLAGPNATESTAVAQEDMHVEAQEGHDTQSNQAMLQEVPTTPENNSTLDGENISSLHPQLTVEQGTAEAAPMLASKDALASSEATETGESAGVIIPLSNESNNASGPTASVSSQPSSTSSNMVADTPSSSTAADATTDKQRLFGKKHRRPYKPRGPYRVRLRQPHERTKVIIQRMIHSRVSTLPMPEGDLETKFSDRGELDSMRHYPYDYPYLHHDFPYEDHSIQSRKVRLREAAIKPLDDSWFLPQGSVAPEDLFCKKKLDYTLSILEAARATQVVSGVKFDDAQYYGKGFALAALKVLDKIKKEEVDKVLRVSDEAVDRVYNNQEQQGDSQTDLRLREAIARMTRLTCPAPQVHNDATFPFDRHTPVTSIASHESSSTMDPSPEREAAQAMATSPSQAPLESQPSTLAALTTPPTIPVSAVDETEDIDARQFGPASKVGDVIYNLVDTAGQASRTAVEQAIRDNSIGRQHLSQADPSSPVDLADYYQANLFLSAIFSPTVETNAEPLKLSHGACRIIQTLLSALDSKLVAMGCRRQRIELTRLLASANLDMITSAKRSNRGVKKKSIEAPAKKGRKPKLPLAPSWSERQVTNPLGMHLEMDPFARARKHVIEQTAALKDTQRLRQVQERHAQQTLEEERQALLAREKQQINQILLKRKEDELGLTPVVAVSDTQNTPVAI